MTETIIKLWYMWAREYADGLCDCDFDAWLETRAGGW